MMRTQQSVTFVSICCCIIALFFSSTALATFDDFTCVSEQQLQRGFQFISPNLNFTENGIVREWKIGVNSSISRTGYLQIWRSMGTSYTRVAEHVYVKTTAGTIDTVSVSMTAMAGDVIGYYSQRKNKGLFVKWVPQVGHTMFQGARSRISETPLPTIQSFSTKAVSSPLIWVSFDPDVTPSIATSSDPGCLSNFGAFLYPCTEATVSASRLYIALDMRFECDGVITEWKVGLEEDGDGKAVYLQVWRSMETQYSRVSEVPYTKNNGERLATVAASMDVLAGDVVGFYVPDGQLQPLWVAAPMFSLMSTDQPNPTDSVQIAGLTSVASSPLISVSFEPKLTPLPSMMTTLVEEFTSMEQSSSNPESSATSEEPKLTTTPSKMTTPVEESTLVEQSTSSLVVSTIKFPASSPSANGELMKDSTVIAVAVVLVLLFVLALLVAVVVVATVLVCCRSKKKRSSRGTNGSAGGINGAAYDPDASAGGVSLMYYNTAVLPPDNVGTFADNGLEEPHLYETAMGKVVADGYETTMFLTTATIYEEPSLLPAKENHYEFGFQNSDCHVYGYVSSKSVKSTDQSLDSKEANNDIVSMWSDGDSESTLYEGIPFTEPSNQVNKLYGQLSQTKCIELPPQVIRRHAILGAGEFGEVFKGVWDSPHGPEDVAVKLLQEKATADDKVKFLKEAAIMSQFRHPNVVRLIGAVTLTEPTMLVLEFLHNGNLLDYLSSNKAKQDGTLAAKLLSFTRDVASGMKYLSKKEFVHRDLAARNILLDKNLKCKVADFGLSRNVSDDNYYIAVKGKIPVRWTAPESLLYKKFSTMSDVWSFGMLMFEIWSIGANPFGAFSPMEVARQIQSDTLKIQAPPPGCPKSVYRIMVLCWNWDNHSRPDFSEIVTLLYERSELILDIPKASLQGVSNPTEAVLLGAPLECSQDLYLDLQHFYHMYAM